jgi:hypothetical protein
MEALARWIGFRKKAGMTRDAGHGFYAWVSGYGIAAMSKAEFEMLTQLEFPVHRISK